MLVLVILFGAVWYFGLIERYLPGMLPKSGWVLRREQAAVPAAPPVVEEPSPAPAPAD